ncbi:MAG TPA: BMP family ABC transporter substrate-binding protein, partial [Pseudothermotoga sp.]|nr:BMP family ABC transporter substrate-binding protein [Pseudothermotoga sp.]
EENVIDFTLDENYFTQFVSENIAEKMRQIFNSLKNGEIDPLEK